MLRGQLAHFRCADEHDSPALQFSKNLPRQLDGGDAAAKLLEDGVHHTAVSGRDDPQAARLGTLARELLFESRDGCVSARDHAQGGRVHGREIELLAGVLGVEARGGDPLSLSNELVSRLRADDAELEARAWQALLEIVRGKLAIVKPGHDAYDFRDELDS